MRTQAHRKINTTRVQLTSGRKHRQCTFSSRVHKT